MTENMYNSTDIDLNCSLCHRCYSQLHQWSQEPNWLRHYTLHHGSLFCTRLKRLVRDQLYNPFVRSISDEEKKSFFEIGTRWNREILIWRFQGEMKFIFLVKIEKKIELNIFLLFLNLVMSNWVIILNKTANTNKLNACNEALIILAKHSLSN